MFPLTWAASPRARSRRALGALLAIGLSVGVSACGDSESLTIYGPATAAVGELAVYSAAAGLDCPKKVFGGPSDPTGAFIICHPYHNLTKIVAATCDGDACAVESVDPPSATGDAALHVVGSVAGPTVLRVRAELDDGSQLNATASISFVTPTGLHASCDVSEAGVPTPYGQCGGLYPVFANSYWKWIVSFETDAGLVPAFDPSIGLQGSAIEYDNTTGWFGAGPTDATTEVVISTRQLTETVPVRVVSPADVVSGEVRLVTLGDGIEQEIAQIGPAPSTLWYPTKNGARFDGDVGGGGILPLLTLADGSQVYGGAGLFASDHPDVCTIEFPTGANVIQQTLMSPYCTAVGTATFSATVGAASIAWPVTVASPPPSAP